jgi:hypothetical protein
MNQNAASGSPGINKNAASGSRGINQNAAAGFESCHPIFTFGKGIYTKSSMVPTQIILLPGLSRAF